MRVWVGEGVWDKVIGIGVSQVGPDQPVLQSQTPLPPVVPDPSQVPWAKSQGEHAAQSGPQNPGAQSPQSGPSRGALQVQPFTGSQ